METYWFSMEEDLECGQLCNCNAEVDSDFGMEYNKCQHELMNAQSKARQNNIDPSQTMPDFVLIV